MNHKLPIAVYLFVALIVTQLPYLKVYFSIMNTLVHDAFRVILSGGNTFVENSRLKNSLVTYAGYTGESFAAIGLFYLVANQHYHYIIYLLMALLVGAILLWIRNVWSILWALSLVVLLSLSIYFGYRSIIIHTSIFLASIFFVQSIINGIQVFKRSFLERKNPSRTGFFGKIKLIPALIFGIVLLGQSLYAGFFIIKNILRIY